MAIGNPSARVGQGRVRGQGDCATLGNVAQSPCYVGFGEVTSEALPIKNFVPKGQKLPLLEFDLKAPNPADNVDNMEMCEWVVAVRWIKTFTRDEPRTFKGAFANQNVVCKLRQSQTVEFLEREFGGNE